MQGLAPIVLFVYNRPSHTEQTLLALEKNDLAKDSILYVFADGPKEGASEETLNDIKRTREIVRSKNWCKAIHIKEWQHNCGLANNIIAGVSEVVSQYGKIIVLEDDLITSKGFLAYMNKALELYENSNNVYQISGHFFPLPKIKRLNRSHFLPLITTWGWATWKRAWDKFDEQGKDYEKLKTDTELSKRFDLDGAYPYTEMMLDQMERKTINSWGIRWWWSVFKQNGITLYPDKSLVLNNGYGEGATHTKTGDSSDNDFQADYSINVYPSQATLNDNLYTLLKYYLRYKYISPFVMQIKKYLGYRMRALIFNY